MLDPGHGDGYNAMAGTGYDEGTYMRYMAEVLKPKLEALGAKVIVTRDRDNTDVQVRTCDYNILALSVVREDREQKLAAAPSSPDAAAWRALILECVQLEALLATIRESSLMQSTYFNTPYDSTRTIHPTLARIFEIQNDLAVYERLMYLSLHSNATADINQTSTRGTWSFYVDSSYGSYYQAYGNEVGERYFSQQLADNVSAAMDTQNRGSMCNDYYVIRETNAPAILLEIGFHTNPGDREKLMNATYRAAVADAITLSLQRYFEKYYPVITTLASPSTEPPYELLPTAVLSSERYMTAAFGLLGVPVGTTQDDLIENLSSDYYDITISDAQGQPKPTQALITGDLLNLELEENIEPTVAIGQSLTLPITMCGDVSGSGEVDLLSLLMIRRHLLEIELLQGPQLLAADVNLDGEVDLVDLLLVRRYLLELQPTLP